MQSTIESKGKKSEIQDKAIELKNKGNSALNDKNYEIAIDYYTQANQLDDTSAVILANRCLAYIKIESYGLAISDATQAIKLDPGYTKAYYRRGLAYSAILKYDDALADFRLVCERQPNDSTVKSKYVQCQQIIRQLAFAKAIEVENEPLLYDTLNIQHMNIDGNYDGPELSIDFDKDNRVTANITEDFINILIERFKAGKLIPKKYVYAIVLHAMRLFHDEPTMIDVDISDNQLITVCGDTHGQYFDLLNIFKMSGMPSNDHFYLFNGDFVDRGSWSCEIAIILYCLKILYPGKFFINRGNHETVNMNKVYGFEGECKHKFGSEMVFKLFSESFTFLPLATLIGKSYLVLHGGLFSDPKTSLKEIQALDRFRQPQPGNEGVMMEMLWTDPQESNGTAPSKRGVGIQFGPDITERFCSTNNLKGVIRSHEVRDEGYSIEHNGKLITVFSAPNYCDSQGNQGAYIDIRKDMKLDFHQFNAVSHPNVRPMAYANSLMGF